MVFYHSEFRMWNGVNNRIPDWRGFSNQRRQNCDQRSDGRLISNKPLIIIRFLKYVSVKIK